MYTAESNLLALREEIMAIVKEVTKGYIWHKDPFHLTSHFPEGGDVEVGHVLGGRWTLRAMTCGCVADYLWVLLCFPPKCSLYSLICGV